MTLNANLQYRTNRRMASLATDDTQNGEGPYLFVIPSVPVIDQVVQ